MNASNPPPNPPHQHLDRDALWDMAEALALHVGGHEGRPIHQGAAIAETAIAEAKACQLCAPKLEEAVRQIATMHTLPEIKAPPDFLLLVQKRIETENSFWKRIAATLQGWVMPRRAVGVPMGFASALLLVVVLMVVLPKDEIEEKIAPVADLESAPAAKADLESNPKPEPDKDQGAKATLPAVVSEEGAPSIKDADFKRSALEKKGKAEKATAPAGTLIPPSSPPPSAASEVPAGYSKALGQSNSAVSKESPRPAAKAIVRSKRAESQEISALADFESREGGAKPEAFMLAKEGEDLNQVREVLARRWLEFAQRPFLQSGDTLVFEGRRDQARRLRHLVDSLGLASKAEFEFRGDSLYFKLRP